MTKNKTKYVDDDNSATIKMLSSTLCLEFCKNQRFIFFKVEKTSTVYKSTDCRKYFNTSEKQLHHLQSLPLPLY